MTELLYRRAPCLRETPVKVLHSTPECIKTDVTNFYPQGGGQPGDCGWLEWDGGETSIRTTRKTEDGDNLLIPEDGAMLPPPGTRGLLRLNWDIRYRHMRVHTALHLLSAVIALPVTGGQISAEKGRLDFDMPQAPDNRQALEDRLNALIYRDLPVSEEWITEAELAAEPSLVKTMSVAPPIGQGRIRLMRIGMGPDQVDLQPCGGTHVARTIEVGQVTLGKIEKKGRQNRRVSLHLAEGTQWESGHPAR